MNLKTSIAASAVQEVLDSAANAAQKGQAQYHTPADWGKALALALPSFRPGLVDLTCGNGALLQAARLQNAGHLLGCEIQPHPEQTHLHRITADLTTLYPLLKQVDFRADLFVLNPPWDMHWYRAKLAALADSSLPAVALAFAAHDARTSRDTIDSTIATLLIALDCSSRAGEGFLIANEATLQRLLFQPDAPHHALTQHIWAHLVVPGNLCAGASANFVSDFKTGIIWFAREHTAGFTDPRAEQTAPDAAAARHVTTWFQQNRLLLREGAEVQPYLAHTAESALEQWRAVGEEVRRLQDPNHRLDNIWLEHGRIRTALSLYDEASHRVDKDQAARLHELRQHTPQRLVMKRESRRLLSELAAGRSPWRVCPLLVTAIQQAVQRYEEQRTPLRALNAVQRLGYLDEYDFIDCTQDLGEGGAPLLPDSKLKPIPLFRAGGRYPIRTTSVMVKRAGRRMNLHGTYDDVQWDGQELAIFIKDDFGKEQLFMEARLRELRTRVAVIAPHQRAAFVRLGLDKVEPCAIDFTIEELVQHFDIPAVPDVAERDPARYQQQLHQLAAIEAALAG